MAVLEGFFFLCICIFPLYLSLFYISHPVFFVTSEGDHVVITHNIVVNSLAG
jgi:hypothetical protein